MTNFLSITFLFLLWRDRKYALWRDVFLTKSCIAFMYYAILSLFLFFSNEVVVGLEVVGCLKVYLQYLCVKNRVMERR